VDSIKMDENNLPLNLLRILNYSKSIIPTLIND